MQIYNIYPKNIYNNNKETQPLLVSTFFAVRIENLQNVVLKCS